MEPRAITRQVIDFNKAVFNNTYYGATVMQDYAQNMMNGYLRQFPFVTEEHKKSLDDFLRYLKKAGDQYKEAVDLSFEYLEKINENK